MFHRTLIRFLKFFLFIVYLAALGPCWCMHAFSGCSERALLEFAVFRLLTVVASLVAEHRLYSRWA